MSSDTWHDHVVHLCEWLTLSQVSKEGNKWKRKKSRKIVKKTCGMEESGGEFPPNFEQFGG